MARAHTVVYVARHEHNRLGHHRCTCRGGRHQRPHLSQPCHQMDPNPASGKVYAVLVTVLQPSLSEVPRHARGGGTGVGSAPFTAEKSETVELTTSGPGTVPRYRPRCGIQEDAQAN
jgi:hypothetical protein